MTTPVTWIVARRRRGESLAQIASAHGVTRERVRQILARHGGLDQADICADLQENERAKVAARTGDILDAYRRGDDGGDNRPHAGSSTKVCGRADRG